MASPKIPHLVANEWSKQLHVKGKPFLMLAGELQNSSLTSAKYMAPIWQKMKDTNINTLLGCVTWEDIEPEEGVFDFSELDKCIIGAREHDMHLVLLWFGSYKNGISSYTPPWVKKDITRFPRAILRQAGGNLQHSDTLSLFYPEARKADAKAFAELMSHLKDFDEKHSTVLMVQVENEPGLLGDCRDGSEAAEKAFNEPVPDELVEFLASDFESLHENMKILHLQEFDPQCPKRGANWTEMFGADTLRVSELFQAYHLCKFVEDVAAAGRAAYNLPMYINVWINYADDTSDIPSASTVNHKVGGGDLPGIYPSGGPCPNVLDVWQKFAPSLDFISPDIYLNDYDTTCLRYRHRNMPLFVPEQRRDAYGARRIWIAYGSHAALGASPFGIDTVQPDVNPFTKHYALLKSVSAHVLDAQRRPHSSVGFCFDELPATYPETPDPCPLVVREWGGFEITIERCFVYGKPGPGAGMVIYKGDGKFLLIGWGFHVKAKSLDKTSKYTGILKFQELTVKNEETGEFEKCRNLNGDETTGGLYGMMPNEDPDYGGYPICVTIPARTMIAQIEFYSVS